MFTATRFLGLLAIATCSTAEAVAQRPPAQPAEPRDPVVVIREAFRRHRLVGLGEAHRFREQHAFFRALLADPRLRGVFQDVVVEFGNARYQAVMDAYVAGRDVPMDSLREAWRNTTAVTLWDSPSYERFFAGIRAANAERPPSDRIRVLLGDPPIRWDTLRTAEQVNRWLEATSRNEFFVGVVEREVLANGRRALLIAGSGHLMRPPPAWRREFPEGGPNETGFLEHRYPGSIFVIGVHDPNARRPDRERLMARWPRPAIALLSGTSLGNTPEDDTMLADLWDAYLYLGPVATLHFEAPPESLYLATTRYGQEVRRRTRLLEDAGIMPRSGPR